MVGLLEVKDTPGEERHIWLEVKHERAHPAFRNQLKVVPTPGQKDSIHMKRAFILASLLFAVSVVSAAPRVAIAPVEYKPIQGFSGSWANPSQFVQARLQDVAPAIGSEYGITVVDRENLETVRAEQNLRNDELMDPTTFPDKGQGLGATLLLKVTVLRCTFESQRERQSFSFGRCSETNLDRETGTATVWLQATLTDVARLVVVPSAAARESVSGLISDRSQVNRIYLHQQVEVDVNDIATDLVSKATDRAIVGVLGRLLPLVSQTAAVREGWKYDPVTRQPLGLPHCTQCGKEAPDASSNFCPFDGRPYVQEQASINLVCPKCGRRAFNEEMTICPIDGEHLRPAAQKATAPVTPQAGTICPVPE